MNHGLKGVSKKLHSTAVKMLNITGTVFGMSRPAEIFFTIRDGVWSDPGIWQTVSGRTGKMPGINDDVYIHNNVQYTTGGATTNVSSLYISTDAKLIWSATPALKSIGVNGNLQCMGLLDLSLSNTNADGIYIYGQNNRIDNFLTNTTATFSYRGTRNQNILNLPYGNLECLSTTNCTKYLTSDLTVNSFSSSLMLANANAWLSGTVELGPYNFTVNTTAALGGTFRKSNTGSVLFIGQMSTGTVTNIDFSNSNCSHEYRGGIAFGASGVYNFGTGPMTFSSNSQTISGLFNSGTIQLWSPQVVGAITVTNAVSPGIILQINNSLDGTIAGSSFINKGIVYFNTTTIPMSTAGTFDKDNFNSNIVGYVYNGSMTLPYNSYQGLYIAGTGTKTQASGSNTIGTTLTIATGARLDSAGNTTVGTNTVNSGTFNANSYNWIFTGTTTTANASFFNKSGAGSLTFVGTIAFQAGSTTNFSGNPSIEYRGGIDFGTVTSFNSGTGTFNFTTNSQNIRYTNGGTSNQMNIVGDILISGPITVTNTNSGSSKMFIRHSGILNGTVAGSTFVNKDNYSILNAANLPMTTGVFDLSTAGNNICYIFNGNYTLPYNSYKGLCVSGTGTKSLSSNTTADNIWLAEFNIPGIGGTANNGTLDCLTYDLTVNTAANLSTGTFLKSGAGNILFNGLVTMAGMTMNLSGNPTVEYRGNIAFGGTSVSMSSGTGVWNFTTNNQALYTSVAGTLNLIIDAPILISGAISLTLGTTHTGSITFTGGINGNNPASTLTNSGTSSIAHKNAARPMIIGILQTNTAANTWIYNLAGAQDITGGTYRTLTLAGSGVKTLQGNVVVVTTYTLTAPATLNLNGFTRT